MLPIFATVLFAAAAMACEPDCTTKSIGILSGYRIDMNEVIIPYQRSGRSSFRSCPYDDQPVGATLKACDCDSYPTVIMHENDHDVEFGDIFRNGGTACTATVHKTVFCPNRVQGDARSGAPKMAAASSGAGVLSVIAN